MKQAERDKRRRIRALRARAERAESRLLREAWLVEAARLEQELLGTQTPRDGRY